MKFTKILLLIMVFNSAILAEVINKSFFKDIAVEGYDTVAYFTVSKPVKGNEKFEFKWNGAIWRFSSQENLDKFKAEPNKYAPQYGGYCAFAMSTGSKYGINPNAWTIANGKLYLNYDSEIQDKWLKNQNDYIQKADTYWKKIN